MATLIDNSVLAETRAAKGSSVCVGKIDFIEETFNKFQINPGDAFITDRLFVEIIGHGKIRANIEKQCESFFKEWKKNIFDVLLGDDKTQMQDVIDHYIHALEKLFFCEFQSLLSQKNIYLLTLENVAKYEFVKYFDPFKSKLICYGKGLEENEFNYKIFINALVEDSVVRYLFDSVDIRQIKPKLHAAVFDFLNLGLRALMVRYNSTGILQTNLNLLMSVLKDNIEAQLKPGKQSQPLFRVYNDFADPELGYFPIHGKIENGLFVPTTVVTAEPQHRVEERLKYNFQAVGTKAEIIGPQKLMTGRSVLLDFENYTYKEIVTKEYVKKNFKFASGKSIF